MVEDILERTYQDVVIDTRDAIEKHAGEPGAPEWAKEAVAASVQRQAAPEGAEPIESENTGSLLTEENSGQEKTARENRKPRIRRRAGRCRN